jgi:hypothetical protein
MKKEAVEHIGGEDGVPILLIHTETLYCYAGEMPA